jgi:hypothetical protein
VKSNGFNLIKMEIMKTSKAKVTGRPRKTSETKKAVKSKKVLTSKSEPGEAEIRDKAKEIYKQRIERGEHGTPLDDWYKAEELLKGSKKK